MTDIDSDIICMTCCQSPDFDAPNTGDWDDYGHSDSAHYPNWSHEPSEELDITNALIDGTWS